MRGNWSIPMDRRFISLALIAAIFGCPLWCSMGVCQCGGGSWAASKMCTASGDTQACCQPTCCSGVCEAAHSPCASGRNTPDPDSEEMRCQGICGGAIFESPCQVPPVELSLFLPLIPNDHDALVATQQDPVPAVHSDECNWQKHRGGSLRLWLMSFQC